MTKNAEWSTIDFWDPTQNGFRFWQKQINSYSTKFTNTCFQERNKSDKTPLKIVAVIQSDKLYFRNTVFNYVTAHEHWSPNTKLREGNVLQVAVCSRGEG